MCSKSKLNFQRISYECCHVECAIFVVPWKFRPKNVWKAAEFPYYLELPHLNRLLLFNIIWATISFQSRSTRPKLNSKKSRRFKAEKQKKRVERQYQMWMLQTVNCVVILICTNLHLLNEFQSFFGSFAGCMAFFVLFIAKTRKIFYLWIKQNPIFKGEKVATDKNKKGLIFPVVSVHLNRVDRLSFW